MNWKPLESETHWTMEAADVPGGIVLRASHVGNGEMSVSLCFIPNVRLELRLMENFYRIVSA